ncbi:MAG: hypothetical protein AAFO82_22325, partial [Bacteroidota bacterium]
ISKNTDKLKQSIEFIQNEEVKNQIVAYAEGVESKVDAFKSNVEQWYDNIMDRTSGWYKRQTQAILFGIGITIAASFNADVIAIYRQLSSDPELALQIANQAQAFATEQQKPDSYSSVTGDELLSGEDIGQLKKLIKEDISSVQSPLGIGWAIVDTNEMGVLDWFLKFGGWLVTAFGVMLGAPFWFDLLRKLVNIRNTGAKP